MKKLLISIIFYTMLGFIFGQIILEKFYEKSTIRQDKYFFIEETSSKDIKKVFGITKDYEVAETIADMYNGKHIMIIEKYLTNEELKVNVEQFDLLVKAAKNRDEIKKIEEVVIANYEEIVNSS